MKNQKAKTANPSDISTLFATLCETVTALLEHKDCPMLVGNYLSEMVDNLTNATSVHSAQNSARHLLPLALMELQKDEAEEMKAIDERDRRALQATPVTA